MLANIILIGMPGAGKSTVGVVLAKRMQKKFIDTDLLIQEEQNLTLHQIMERDGLDGFLKIENEVLKKLDVQNCIIATGGSAIYGKEAMEHMKKSGHIVYLKLSYESICSRLGDLKERGVVISPGKTLQELYNERICLYQKYCDIEINCEKKELKDIVGEISDLYTE